MGKYNALGPMIQGLRLPMHDLSRGCSVEDMIDVTLVANKMAATKGVSMRNELKKAVSGLIGVNPYAVDKQYAAKCAVPSF